MDKGPWKAEVHEESLGFGRKRKVFCVASEDFAHDVWLDVSGDFADDEEREAYCRWLADKLNAQTVSGDAKP